jgi:hypothetical protein
MHLRKQTFERQQLEAALDSSTSSAVRSGASANALSFALPAFFQCIDIAFAHSDVVKLNSSDSVLL